MKKQILTLAMCLALTTTAALASSTPAVVKKAPAKATQQAVKKVANVKKAAAVVTPAKTPEVTLTPEQLAKKKFEERMAAEREHLYSDLCLTADQKVKAEALDAKTKTEAEPLIQNVRAEKVKLVELKAKKAAVAEICKQEKALKVAKKVAKAHFKASRKAFEAILTPEQLVKYQALREARKAEMKKHQNCKCPCHKHHGPKFGPEAGPQGPGQVPPMGPAPKCPCETK